MPEANAGGRTPWDECVLLDLSFGRWGVQRKIADGECNVEEASSGEAVPPQALRLSKRLLACDEYDKIASADGEIRRKICEMALPFRRGLHAVPIKLVDRVVEQLRAHEARRADDVSDFLGAYAWAVEQAKVDLGPLFRPDDYPTGDDVRRAFTVRWTFVELGTPGKLRTVNAKLYESEVQKVREQWEEAAQVMQESMRQAFAALVASLRERLDGDRDNGKPKVFRNSRVQGLQEWLALFEARNVASDDALAELVAKAQGLLAGVSADTLRRRGDIREEVAGGLKEIEGACATLAVGDVPRRKFRLDGDA
jgi:hypothetical protein